MQATNSIPMSRPDLLSFEHQPNSPTATFVQEFNYLDSISLTNLPNQSTSMPLVTHMDEKFKEQKKGETGNYVSINESSLTQILSGRGTGPPHGVDPRSLTKTGLEKKHEMKNEVIKRHSKHLEETASKNELLNDTFDATANIPESLSFTNRSEFVSISRSGVDIFTAAGKSMTEALSRHLIQSTGTTDSSCNFVRKATTKWNEVKVMDIEASNCEEKNSSLVYSGLQYASVLGDDWMMAESNSDAISSLGFSPIDDLIPPSSPPTPSLSPPPPSLPSHRPSSPSSDALLSSSSLRDPLSSFRRSRHVFQTVGCHGREASSDTLEGRKDLEMSRKLVDEEGGECKEDDDKSSQEEEKGGGLLSVVKEQPLLSCLFLFIPLGFCSHFLSWGDSLTFSLNFLAIVPQAWLMGKATEDLAVHMGQVAGGLLNAWFGNVVEMLLCIAGLRAGELQIVKATLVGSILSNLLLVTGCSFLFGGFKHKVQEFSAIGASTNASLMTLSCLCLGLPTMYGTMASSDTIAELNISRSVSFFLIFMYIQYLVFQLGTHSFLFSDEDDDDADLSALTASLILATCTVCCTFCSEFLIHSIEGTVANWSISKSFIGIILLPIIGNAAEHYTSVIVAMRNKMDLSLACAVGSSCQMALFVTPFTVLVGWCLGQPMSLNLHAFEMMVLLLSVLIVTSILQDGYSNWLEGSMLVSAYFVIALIYFFEETEIEKEDRLL